MAVAGSLSMLAKAVFIDKDGTLVENIPYNVDPHAIRLAPGAAGALRRLEHSGYCLVVVSNQSGVARGFFAEEALKPVERRLTELCADGGARLAGFYYCPHHPEGTDPRYAIACDCRKPACGLLRRAASELLLDLRRSWMIGDILDDVEAGHSAGCRTVLVESGGETEWCLRPGRIPDRVVPDLAHAARAIIESDWHGPGRPLVSDSSSALYPPPGIRDSHLPFQHV